jgi:hypothetical protein
METSLPFTDLLFCLCYFLVCVLLRTFLNDIEVLSDRTTTRHQCQMDKWGHLDS